MRPTSGIERRHFSTIDLPRNPVLPVTRMVLPWSASAITEWSLESRAGPLGERFGDPGEPDSGEATSSAATASSIRERAAQELNPKTAAWAPKSVDGVPLESPR